MAFMGEIWKWWDQFKWCIFLGGRWCCCSPLSALWPREWDLTSWLLENSFISIPLYSVICCTFKQTQSVFMAFQHEGPILLPVTPLKMHWLQLLWQGADQKAPCNGSNVIEPDCILERQILPTKLLPNLFSVSALQSFYWKPLILYLLLKETLLPLSSKSGCSYLGDLTYGFWNLCLPALRSAADIQSLKSAFHVASSDTTRGLSEGASLPSAAGLEEKSH